MFSLPEDEGGPIQLCRLIGQADQMHLDSAKFFVIKRIVLKLVIANPGTKCTIDAGEQVEIECSGYTTRIIVSALKRGPILF